MERELFAYSYLHISNCGVICNYAAVCQPWNSSQLFPAAMPYLGIIDKCVEQSHPCLFDVFTYVLVRHCQGLLKQELLAALERLFLFSETGIPAD